MKTSKEYRKLAWSALKGNYWNPFLACVIYAAVIGIASAIPGVGSAISLIVMGSASVILVTYLAKFLGGEKPEIGSMFKEPQKNFVNRMVAGLLTTLFTALWACLFVIPGIIKSYSYAMTYYIQSKQDKHGYDAIQLSRKIMNGNKWRMFCLDFSFIGWYLLIGLVAIVLSLLGAISFFFLFLAVACISLSTLFLTPYIQVARTAFMMDVYDNYVAEHPDEFVQENQTTENKENKPEEPTEIVVE